MAQPTTLTPETLKPKEPPSANSVADRINGGRGTLAWARHASYVTRPSQLGRREGWLGPPRGGSLGAGPRRLEGKLLFASVAFPREDPASAQRAASGLRSSAAGAGRGTAARGLMGTREAESSSWLQDASDR